MFRQLCALVIGVVMSLMLVTQPAQAQSNRCAQMDTTNLALFYLNELPEEYDYVMSGERFVEGISPCTVSYVNVTVYESSVGPIRTVEQYSVLFWDRIGATIRSPKFEMVTENLVFGLEAQNSVEVYFARAFPATLFRKVSLFSNQSFNVVELERSALPTLADQAFYGPVGQCQLPSELTMLELLAGSNELRPDAITATTSPFVQQGIWRVVDHNCTAYTTLFVLGPLQSDGYRYEYGVTYFLYSNGDGEQVISQPFTDGGNFFFYPLTTRNLEDGVELTLWYLNGLVHQFVLMDNGTFSVETSNVAWSLVELAVERDKEQQGGPSYIETMLFLSDQHVDFVAQSDDVNWNYGIEEWRPIYGGRLWMLTLYKTSPDQNASFRLDLFAISQANGDWQFSQATISPDSLLHYRLSGRAVATGFVVESCSLSGTIHTYTIASDSNVEYQQTAGECQGNSR